MKAKERILKYGIKAYLKMRGLRKTAARLFYYQDKYPTAKLELPSLAPRISYHMKSYWRDIKMVAEGHGITIKQARKILKRERKDRDVRVHITKTVDGWQLYILGKFKNIETGEIAKAEGFSCLYKNREGKHEEALNECIKSALNSLGGSKFEDSYADIEDNDWVLIEILKERWNRFYGRLL